MPNITPDIKNRSQVCRALGFTFYNLTSLKVKKIERNYNVHEFIKKVMKVYKELDFS
jgi:hypothetical protein